MAAPLVLVPLLLVIPPQLSRGGLLSRSKAAQEYAPPPDSVILPGDWRQETYEDIAEMPQLRERPTLGAPSQTRALDSLQTTHPSEEYFETSQLDANADAEEKGDNADVERYTENDAKSEAGIRLWNSTTDGDEMTGGYKNVSLAGRHGTPNGSARFPPDRTKSGRRWLADWFTGPFDGVLMGICFVCGLRYWNIPVTPYCYEAFQSDDWRMRTLARFSRAQCYNSYKGVTAERKKEYTYAGWTFTEGDAGLKTQYFETKFLTGCFKRWTDIGTVYYQRGCRRHWPWSTARTFAGHRYGRLEVMLRRVKEGCIMSPHASLVPFARGISLYTRFHVCVCNSKYCNGAAGRRRLAFRTRLSFVTLIYLLLIELVT